MTEKISYNRDKPLREELKDCSDELIRVFKEHFSSKGYTEHPQVLISSSIDSTTRFIGSHISVLKPYFIERRIPNRGFFIVQDCVRTQNLKKMYDSSPIMWGSYFTNLGLLTPPDQTKRICFDTFDFFLNALKIDKNSIKVRVSKEDPELETTCLEYFGDNNLERDTKPKEYYQHKYGIKNIFGRNLNIALRGREGNNFLDVGNIIIIKSSEGILGTELGVGNSTILKQIYGLEHVLDIYNIKGIPKSNENQRKFEDCILVCTALFRENLRPSSSNQGQSLRKYLDALNYFRLKEGMSLDRLSQVLFDFESHQFKSARAYRSIIDLLEKMKN